MKLRSDIGATAWNVRSMFMNFSFILPSSRLLSFLKDFDDANNYLGQFYDRVVSIMTLLLKDRFPA